jgi:hypothetical protein
MNATRRGKINEAITAIEHLIADLTEIRDDEQEAFENLPESLQNGDRGDAMQNSVSQLEDAIERLEGANEALEDAKSEA